MSESAWAGEKISKTVVQELDGAEDAEVHLKMNIGSMKIGALPVASEYLITGEVEISEFEILTDDLRVSGDTIYYTLSSEGQQYHPGWLFNRDVDNDKNWDLLLNSDVLMDMDIDIGVGKTEIDLSDFHLTNLDIKSGVGEVIVHMPSEGDFQARFQAGVGKLEVFLPADLAAGIFIDGGLGSVSVLGDFRQTNGNYYTQNYDTSSERLELFVDGGVGNIQIIQLEN